MLPSERLRASKDGPGYEFIGELGYGAAQLFTSDAECQPAG